MRSFQKIAAITINYATPSDTLDCVYSLRQQTYPNLEIIVVDNNSPDGSGIQLKKELNNICTVILSNDNNGFSAGNNIGIDYAISQGARWLLFINNDTILEPNMIQTLYDAVSINTIVIPKTYYYSDKNILWDTGGMFAKNGRLKNRGINEQDCGQYNVQEEVSLFTGHCLLMPVECVEQAGKWDESFFMYIEDTEYSLRVKEHGFHIVYVPQAILWHKVSRSSGGTQNPFTVYYAIRNRLYLRKQYKCPTSFTIYLYMWIIFCVARQYIFRKSSFEYTTRALHDYRHSIKGKVNV